MMSYIFHPSEMCYLVSQFYLSKVRFLHPVRYDHLLTQPDDSSRISF